MAPPAARVEPAARVVIGNGGNGGNAGKAGGTAGAGGAGGLVLGRDGQHGLT